MITVVETPPQSKHFTTQDRINNHLYIFYAEEKSSEINTEGHEIVVHEFCMHLLTPLKWSVISIILIASYLHHSST